MTQSTTTAAREELAREIHDAIRCNSTGAALEWLDSPDAEELIERADMAGLSTREIMRALTGVSI